MQEKLIHKTPYQKCCVKTPSDSEVKLAPFNVLRNFIPIVTKATKDVEQNAVEEVEDEYYEDNTVLDLSSESAIVTNPANQLTENTEQKAVEEKTDDEENTVLHVSYGSTQETQSTGK